MGGFHVRARGSKVFRQMNPVPPPTESPQHSQARPPAGGLSKNRRAEYWRRNLRLLSVLLAIWAAVSFGCGVLLHNWLDQWKLLGSGFPLGFWFAQQGSGCPSRPPRRAWCPSMQSCAAGCPRAPCAARRSTPGASVQLARAPVTARAPPQINRDQ